jgi:alpha-L-rhamnosidase
MYGRDMAAFYTKWMRDIRDSQADDGRFPDYAPHVADPNEHSSGVPGWSDAGVIMPWRLYQNYADTRILEEQFAAAKRWIDFVHSHNPNCLWQKNRGNEFNDWLNGDTVVLEGYPRNISAVPKEVFATAYFAHSTETLAKMAAVLGRRDDASHYANLFAAIKKAFNEAYVSPDGRIQGDTQAGYALALNFNLLEPSLRPKATEWMLQAISKYKNHLSTGIHSTYRIMLELTRNGRHDEAWRIINLRTVPSWGYMIDMGATTIWERWDGYVQGRGFQDPMMNSFNHWALGAVGEWVWRDLAGIHFDEERPGYQHFVVRPRPSEGLTWVKSEYDSIRGRIVSDWSVEGQQFTLHVRAPVNTTATVYLPAKDAASINESGKPLDKVDSVKLIRIEDGNAVLTIESGEYVFHATMPSMER